ncbi:hypothetical protein BE221DRAFT_202020 [Ostreococcus tauri]|uniref:Glutathione reductase n=1 Tax=Ostreococcus tauri TaxID=70448 RepID=A0A1Y5HXT3_OSTTA|nr:hypothetical protein BE221DRAFT_202020 [Ostreococcus tauri]
MLQNDFKYDTYVIGGGSGGVRASRMAAQKGAKVGLCELPFDPISSDSTGGLGGTCVIRGCVPKKLLVYGSSFSAEFSDAAGFGWDMKENPQFSWDKLLAAKNKEIQRLNGIYSRLLEKSGVDVHTGSGKLIDKNTVQVTTPEGKTHTFKAKTILIATGASAFKPDIPGAEFGITSDEALMGKTLPQRIVIVGGGYIALEFAGIFHGLGVEVTVMYRQNLPLGGFDTDVRKAAHENLKRRGIIVKENCAPLGITRSNDGVLTVSTSSGTIPTDTVMFATGRKPNTTRPDLGLEEIGVKCDSHGAIMVDEYSRTSVSSVWAVGDVTNRVNLTPVALMEGMAFVSSTVEGNLTKPNYTNIPCAVFSQPPIATVGLSEEEAVKQGYHCDIYCSEFTPMRSTLAGRQEKTFMKLVVNASNDRVLGVHMVGTDSPEIVQGFAIALQCGATKKQFDSTVGIHPSSAEEFVTMRTKLRSSGDSFSEER